MAGSELGGAAQLRIHGGALSSIHAYGSDERAGGAMKDQGHAVWLSDTFHLNRLKETCGKKLAEAFPDVFRIERRALGLGEVAGKRVKMAGIDAFERDMVHGQSKPMIQSAVLRLGGRLFGWSLVQEDARAVRKRCGVLGPSVAPPRKDDEEESSGLNPGFPENLEAAAKP